MYYLLILLILTGCSPKYLINIGILESKLLINRKPINEDNPIYNDKLKLIRETKEFLKENKFKNINFNYYTEQDNPISYLLIASKKDSFSLHTWWFPIIGNVPYKGFLTLTEAQLEAKELEEQNYETFITDVDAFSTLGWFDDPILTYAMKRDPADLVNLIIHETVHNNFWIKNNIEKNESLANYLGLYGSFDFWTNKIKLCFPNCSSEIKKNYNMSKDNLLNSLELSKQLKLLIKELEAIYKNNDFNKRDLIISKYSKVKGIPKKVNNALLMLKKIYFSELNDFHVKFKNYKQLLLDNNLQAN